MNHNDYINQIEIILKNLNDNLDKFNSDNNTKDELFMKELDSSKILNFNQVKELEKKYLVSDENSNQKIASLKSVILHLESELEKAISDYNTKNNSVIDKENFLGEKDNVLNDYMQNSKKQIQDLNQKISTLDRECILSLKAKLVEFEEDVTIFNNKISELEKRMKFEVNKIENDILTPAIVVDKNDDTQNYQNTKEVREFRKKGINEIAKIKKSHSKEVHDLEVKFYKLEAETEKESKILRKEYNLQIEALKYEIVTIENDIKKTLDDYDFECYKKVNTNERSYQLAKIKINRDFINKFRDYTTRVFVSDNEFSAEWVKQSKEVFNNIKNLDEKNALNYSNYTVQSLKELKVAGLVVSEAMKKTIDIFINMVNKLLNNYSKRVNTLNEVFYKSILINDYKSFNFKDFNYDEYKGRILLLSSDYQKKQNTNLSNFNKLLKDSVINLVKELQVISHNFDNYISEETKLIQETNNSFVAIFNAACNGGIESSLKYFQTKLEMTKANNLNEETKLLELEKNLKKLEEEVNDQFSQRDNELNSKINSYNIILENKKAKDLDNYNEMVKSIKNNITLAKTEYSKIIKKKKLIAHKKLETETKTIKEDQRVKIKIGQI